MKKVVAGMDLHSNNVVIGVMDMDGKRLASRKVSCELKDLEIKEAQKLYVHPANQLIAGMQVKHIEQLTESIEKIEKVVMACARALPPYSKVATLPGVGIILGMTLTMEVGDIKRFASAGDFASYCRTVAAQRTSNSKR